MYVPTTRVAYSLIVSIGQWQRRVMKEWSLGLFFCDPVSGESFGVVDVSQCVGDDFAFCEERSQRSRVSANLFL